MGFQPEKITRENVLQAIQAIENGKVGFRPSTKFDVLYMGKKYPPKDIMRLAHEYATGEYLWIPGGGEPTNKYLKALGFEIVLKKSEQFTWVETHYDLVDYLSQNQNNQLELIELLQSVGITEFTDKDIAFQDIPLTEIDPFTFFCYLYKHGPERRLKILKDLAIKLEITEPSDELGIPSANAQKVWLFPYKANRNNKEIDRLWNFFFSEVDDTITDEQFADVLQIKNVGKVKITESLFYVNPEKYFPLNGPTKPYIEEVFGINSKFTSFSEYKAILEALRKKTDKPFYELSYEAWVWNDKKKKTNYWIFQGNSKIYDVVGALKSNAVTTWKIAAHNEKIKIDDKIILWLTGNKSGCYALAKVVSEVGKYEMTPEEIKFYKESYNENEDRVLIEIEKNYCSNPILWNTIKDESVLKDFNGSNQGTTFTATKAEYDFFFTNTTSSTQTNNIMSTNSLNQILFGPPGTGKTFNTINEALKIVDPSYFKEHQNDRKKVTERFKELLIKNSDENKGQIGFCTFHQSFSYEDFVEGIKPKTTELKSVYYDVEPGIFKRICQLAASYNSTIKVKKEGKLAWDVEQFRKASFYKLSLGALYNPNDKPIYEYCRDNNLIAIGFGQENDFSGLSESEIIEKCEDLKLDVTAAQQMNYFIHYLKKNNYVIIGNGNKYVRAIGKVTGDYEYIENSPIQYNHFRRVEWVFVDENIPIEEIYERGLSQKTMYKIDETALKMDFFTNKGQETLLPINEEKNYVLIIDEINRGNVSAIFGELITLIEKDKRAGCDEELEVILPYSKESFKVPSNVYLIGTMNTADRSIEALDTALRRRFSFKEFAPKPYLIKSEGASSKVSGLVNGIDLESLLNRINARIEKLIDKDHKIGHSYFLKIDTKEKLVHAFKNEIIPLLEEYFFGDYGKIGLVLGSSFVEKVNHDFDFADFTTYDSDIQEDLKEKAVFRIKDENEWNFSKI
jgi:5-methylcytosine-specific restriction protein B